MLLPGLAGDVARAEAAPLCAGGPGPLEYHARLGPLLSGSPTLPPAPPPPVAASRSALYPAAGARQVARDALGGQFATLWANNVVQGWVVGVSPGPLEPEPARARSVDGLVPHFTPTDFAFLTERLYVDPQPYSEMEIHATMAQVSADLAAAGIRAVTVRYGLCTLSDAIRVEVMLDIASDAPTVERVRAILVPYGDRVRLGFSPYSGPPPPVPGESPRPAPALAQPRASVHRYVTMTRPKRCIRGAIARIAVRRGSTDVLSLSVQADGRRRTISGARLRKPLEVRLQRRRTVVEVAVRLRGGRTATKVVTFTRCR